MGNIFNQRQTVRVVLNKGTKPMGLLWVGMVLLKLLGMISISWWLVHLPLYIIPAIGLGIVFLGISIGGVVWILNKLSKLRINPLWRRKK